MDVVQNNEELSPIATPSWWLSGSVLTMGVILTLIFWYFIYYDIPSYFNLLTALQDYTHWVELVLGLFASISVATIIRMAQVARYQADVVAHINESLRTEIGERIAAEGEKQKLEIALLQGQKLQAMGTLAGGIAHDFNNLLYAINGYVDMAREDVDKTSVVYQNLGKVLEASHRGQDLVSRILSFSRRQHQQFDVINLKTAIDAALSLLRPTIPASVIIEFNMSEDVTVLGNQTQIHQVLVNLITNAVDAMDGEGTIKIDTVLIANDDPSLKTIPNMNAKTYCKITVTDTGYGMDQRIINRIFEPFFTTKEVGKGTGLGLSIVHSIVKEHQGEIIVTSQLGHGTTFTIWLPEYTPA